MRAGFEGARTTNAVPQTHLAKYLQQLPSASDRVRPNQRTNVITSRTISHNESIFSSILKSRVRVDVFEANCKSPSSSLLVAPRPSPLPLVVSPICTANTPDE